MNCSCQNLFWKELELDVVGNVRHVEFLFKGLNGSIRECQVRYGMKVISDAFNFLAALFKSKEMNSPVGLSKEFDQGNHWVDVPRVMAAKEHNGLVLVGG